jgi:hypothetical protein
MINNKNSRWIREMKMFTKIILSIFSLIMVLSALFGVYVLPYLPNKWALADGKTVADQIASVNYLLTFIATAGAVGGIAFTVFGYYQATRIEKIVRDAVRSQMETATIDLEKHKTEYSKLIQQVQKERDELKQIIKRFTDDNGYIKNVHIQDLKNPISSLHIHSENVSISGNIEHMKSSINSARIENTVIDRQLMLANSPIFDLYHSSMAISKLYTGSDAPDSILKSRDLREVIEEQMADLSYPDTDETENSQSKDRIHIKMTHE